jgi:hypothetical protein
VVADVTRELRQMSVLNFDWILRTACSASSCLIFDVPLLAAGGLAFAFWWYQRKEDDTW